MENLNQVFDVGIIGGSIVNSSGVFKGSIGINDEKIAAIVNESIPFHAKKIVDANRKLIIPGALDTHAHFRSVQVDGSLDTSGNHCDNFQQLALSAAHGGITTILAFMAGEPEGKFVDHIKQTINEAERTSIVDFTGHARLSAEESTIEEIPEIIRLGITSLKVDTGSINLPRRNFHDNAILRVMELGAKHSGMVQMHAENGYIVDYYQKRLTREGSVSHSNFERSRPSIAEIDAINRSIRMSQVTGCPLYIVHVSSAGGVAEIRKGKAEGAKVFGETCPQYLLLTNKEMERQGPEAKVRPPLRYNEDIESLWEGINDGTIDVVASDHAPRTREQKRRGPIFGPPNGMPGIETILPLIYSEGVAKGRISLMKMVEVLCENPSRIFGLYPQKGVIQVGSEADLVIIDPDGEFIIEAKNQHTASDYSCFEGWKLKGKLMMSLVRGKIVLDRGELKQLPGFGKFIPRTKAGYYNI